MGEESTSAGKWLSDGWMNADGEELPQIQIPSVFSCEPAPPSNRFTFTLGTGAIAILNIPCDLTLPEWKRIDTVWQTLKPKQKRARKKTKDDG